MPSNALHQPPDNPVFHPLPVKMHQKKLTNSLGNAKEDKHLHLVQLQEKN